MKCNEVMTKKTVCCLPNDMVSKVAQLMKSENVGSIPIIEDEQTRKLVGIVTDRDLTLKIVAEGLEAKSTKVADVMICEVITCLVAMIYRRRWMRWPDINCAVFLS